MEVGRCQGTTVVGKACGARALPGDVFCPWHSPAYAGRRKAWSAKGGEGKATVNRATRRLPKDLRDVLDVLLRALRDTEGGTMTPATAQALGSLSRAIVGIHQAGEVDQRLAAIEERLGIGDGKSA